MEKVRFGYRNRIDAATLSGGSWQAPLTNIQTLRLAQRARSTTTSSNDCLINIEFDEDRLIQVVSVNAHNISAYGDVRIFAGSAPGLNDLYDSGKVEGATLLEKNFGIRHSTIQVLGEEADCRKLGCGGSECPFEVAAPAGS